MSSTWPSRCLRLSSVDLRSSFCFYSSSLKIWIWLSKSLWMSLSFWFSETSTLRSRERSLHSRVFISKSLRTLFYSFLSYDFSISTFLKSPSFVTSSRSKPWAVLENCWNLFCNSSKSASKLHYLLFRSSYSSILLTSSLLYVSLSWS